MVHISYVLQLYNVRSAKRTSFAYKPYTPNGRQKLNDVLNDQAMEPVQAQELKYNMTWKTKYRFISEPLTVSTKQLSCLQ